MKILLILSICLVASGRIFADDYKLSDGREYKGVTISRAEPDGLVVVTDSGIEKLPFDLLPKEIQKQYGYNPQKALSYKQLNQQARAAAVAAENDKLAAKKQTEDAQPKQHEAAANTDAQSVSLSAVELYFAYKQNEVQADADFKGKPVSISGTILKIENDFKGRPCVYLRVGSDESLAIVCRFDNPDNLKGLVPMQSTTVSGTVEGKKRNAYFVFLKSCKLQ